MPRVISSLSKRLAAMLVAGMLVACTQAPREGFETGYAAYQRGDFATALKIWRPLAESGHALAQYNLGMLYADGRGVVQNRARAISWLHKAAEQNIAQAQFNLAGFHLSGGEPDYAETRFWLARAAESGLDRAQHTLAKLHENGLGTPVDHIIAYRYYSLAAQQGHLPAMYNLGKVFRDGRGVDADESESLKWFRSAAEGGYAKAQAKLGQRYAAGRGVPQDDVEAYVWTALAAQQGLLSAAKQVNTMVARLSEPERQQAQERINKFEKTRIR